MKSCQILFLSFLMMVVTGGLVLLSADQKSSGVMPIGKQVQIKAPLGLPPVAAPADNPPTAETIMLGRRLYYDPVLSADNTVSCATCHGVLGKASMSVAQLLKLGAGAAYSASWSVTV